MRAIAGFIVLFVCALVTIGGCATTFNPAQTPSITPAIRQAADANLQLGGRLTTLAGSLTTHMEKIKAATTQPAVVAEAVGAQADAKEVATVGTTLTSTVAPQLNQAAANSAKIDTERKSQADEIVKLTKQVKDLQATVVKQQEEAKAGFTRSLDHWALLLALAAIPALFVTGWELYSLNGRGVTIAGAVFASLIAASSLLHWYAAHLVIVEIISGLAVAGVIAYLVVTRASLSTVKTALANTTTSLKSVVASVEAQAPDIADQVKSGVEAAAGTAAKVVKQTITEVKHELGLAGPTPPVHPVVQAARAAVAAQTPVVYSGSAT